MVGATGFEPATSCSRSRRATKLRYAPTPPGLGHTPGLPRRGSGLPRVLPDQLHEHASAVLGRRRIPPSHLLDDLQHLAGVRRPAPPSGRLRRAARTAAAAPRARPPPPGCDRRAPRPAQPYVPSAVSHHTLVYPSSSRICRARAASARKPLDRSTPARASSAEHGGLIAGARADLQHLLRARRARAAASCAPTM